MIFIESKNETFNHLKVIIDDTLLIVMFLFTLLWLQKLIFLFGLIFSVIAFNIELAANRLLPSIKFFDPFTFANYSSALYVLGLICFLVGLSDKIKIGRLTKEIDLRPVSVIGVSLILTAFTQIIIRL